MKKLLVLTILLAVVGICIGGGNSVRTTFSDVSASSGAKTNALTHVFSGMLESVYIDVTSPATQTVSIVDGAGVTVFSATASADTIWRPIYTGNSYDGTSTNQPTKHYFYGEKISVIMSATQTNYLDSAVIIKTRE